MSRGRGAAIRIAVVTLALAAGQSALPAIAHPAPGLPSPVIRPLSPVTRPSSLPVRHSSTAGGWTQFRYNTAHTGYNPAETQIGPGTIANLEPMWLRAQGSARALLNSYSSPVVAGSYLYETAGTGPSSCSQIVALSLATGHVKWSHAAAGGCSDPVVVGNRLYAVYDNGVNSTIPTLAALNLKNGKTVWSKKLGNLWVSTPVVSGKDVWVNTDLGTLMEFNAVTGAKLKNLRLDTSLVTNAPALSNGVVYTVGIDGAVFAVGAAKGNFLWQSAVGSIDDASLHPSIAVSGGMALVAATDGTVNGLQLSSQGKVLWSTPPAGQVPGLAVANGEVYVSNLSPRQPSVEDLNAQTGQSTWSYSTGQPGSDPEVANGIVYFTSGDDVLYGLNASSGSVLWSSQNLGSQPAYPAITGGHVYLNNVAFELGSAHAFHQVTSSGYSACALRNDGKTLCWGYDRTGEADPPNTAFTQLLQAGNGACGLTAAGAVDCWGNNDDGQDAVPAGSYLGLAGTDWGLNVCAIRSDRSLACWGDSSQGVDTPPPGQFEQVEVGGYFACGLHVDGTLACWGNNSDNETAPPSGRFVQLAVGGGFACARRADGSVACWGDTYDATNAPSGSLLFATISASTDEACGVTIFGLDDCWTFGTGEGVPGANLPSAPIAEIDAADVSACGILFGGGLDCWGNDGTGVLEYPALPFTQLGDGASCAIHSNQSAACWNVSYTYYDGVQYNEPPPAGAFKQISTGAGQQYQQNQTYEVSCGVKTSGALTCWQPANVTTSYSYPKTGTYLQVSLGDSSGSTPCAIKTDHTIVCWNDGGRSVPSVDLNSLSSGDQFLCGIKTDSTVYCWSESPQPPPSGAPSGGSYAQVAVGSDFACALSSAGAVTCWGGNNSGAPMRPSGTYSRIAASSNNACGLKTTGAIVCWGTDGNGPTVDAPAGSYTQLSMNGNVCGLAADGSVRCESNYPDSFIMVPNQ